MLLKVISARPRMLGTEEKTVNTHALLLHLQDCLPQQRKLLMQSVLRQPYSDDGGDLDAELAQPRRRSGNAQIPLSTCDIASVPASPHARCSSHARRDEATLTYSRQSRSACCDRVACWFAQQAARRKLANCAEAMSAWRGIRVRAWSWAWNPPQHLQHWPLSSAAGVTRTGAIDRFQSPEKESDSES
ncbi:uncharacterized protein BDZ99DRAFT_32908 [Mytilinidion resinicola]|uniref:Uncharacterized protein n=1 Tax=Mytilinidion resinicola TaxID=574789 RepID=A0A6A6YP36_9PEZI|nr:uncharacterized protein BDZ99DRAFT_32908 [Mytilinidion resinicola]KAF2809627.1 hypothetical protein BDZ99DRAFT_32908 [Mytilinidion resinicola]